MREEYVMPEISLPATKDSISQATAFIHEHLGDRYAKLLTYVELTVEELLVNVASYAYDKDIGKDHPKHGQLVLGCRWVNLDGHKHFCVWLRDWGRPFDPFCVEQPDTSLPVEERKTGGLGVHLVKHISSHYIYSGTDGSNTVELFFRVDAA